MRPSSASAVREWQAEQSTYGPDDDDGYCPGCGAALELIDGSWQCPREVEAADFARRLVAAVTAAEPTGDGRCPACGGLLRQYGDEWLCPVGLEVELRSAEADAEIRSILRDMAAAGELDPTADELEF